MSCWGTTLGTRIGDCLRFDCRYNEHSDEMNNTIPTEECEHVKYILVAKYYATGFVVLGIFCKEHYTCHIIPMVQPWCIKLGVPSVLVGDTASQFDHQSLRKLAS